MSSPCPRLSVTEHKCYRDAQLAGAQQCAAHLIRHATGVLGLRPTWQQWAGQVIGVLYEAAVAAAQAYGRDHLHVHMQVNIRTRRAAVEASP